MTQKSALKRHAVSVAVLTIPAILAGCSESAPADDAVDRVVAVETALVAPTPSPTNSYEIKEVVEKEQTLTASFGTSQIRQYSVENAAHAEGGRLQVTYFDKNGEHSADYPKAVVMGSWGRMDQWSVEQGYSDFPVIVAEGGGSWQGYTCVWTSLTELQPTGPVELLRLQTYYSNSGTERDPEKFEGTVGPPAADGSFVVSFEGTEKFSTKYRREGDAYTVVSGEELDGC